MYCSITWFIKKKTQWTIYRVHHFYKYTQISLVLFKGYIVLYHTLNQFPIGHLDRLQLLAIIPHAPVNSVPQTSLHSGLFL